MAFGTKMPPSTSLFNSDFANWKIKLCNFIEYKDPKLWNWFKTIDRYEQPRLDGVLKSRAQMSVNEREEFDKDNKAYEMITMCLPKVVINNFKNQATSTDLWDALIEAYDQKKRLINEEEDQHTAIVAQLKEVDSNAFKCLSCFKLTGDNNRYRYDNQNLRSNLENLTQANKVLKANELAYEKKFKAYQDESQAFKAKIYSQQDAINSYLKEITLLKKELEDSKSEVDDLKRKMSNFSTSSMIFDHILDKQRTDTKSKAGLGYNHVPPPMDYLPMPNKDAIKDFVPSSSKVDTNSVNAPVNEQSKQVELVRPTFVKAENKPPVSVEEVVEVEDIPEVSTIKVEKKTVKPDCFKCKGKAKVDNESFKVKNVKRDSKSTNSTSGTSTSTCSPKSACSTNVPVHRPSVYCPPPKRFEGTHWNQSYVEKRSCYRCGQQGHIIRDCKLLSLDRFGRGMSRTSSFRNSFSKSFSRHRSYSPVSSCASNSPKPMARVNKVVPSRPQVQQHNIVENKSSKPKQVWKSKSTNNASMKSSEFLKYHKLIDVMIMDDHGQPKSIKAWVSHKY